MKKINLLSLTSSILLVSLSIPLLINGTNKKSSMKQNLNTNNNLYNDDENSDSDSVSEDGNFKIFQRMFNVNRCDNSTFNTYFAFSEDNEEITFEKNIPYSINANELFKNYLIGDANKYKFFKNIKIMPIEEETEKNIQWFTSLFNNTDKITKWENPKYGLFSTISCNIEWDSANDVAADSEFEQENIPFSIFDIYNWETKFTEKTAVTTDKGSTNTDVSSVTMSTKVKYNPFDNNIYFTQFNKLYAYDGWSWESNPNSESKIVILNNSPTINADIILPYSEYDVNVFKQFFKDTLAQPIRIKDSKNPVIFDYRNGNNVSENEKIVNDKINERIKTFYNQESVLNKLGYLTKWNSNTNEYVNTGNTEIKLIVPDTIRGKVGSQIVDVEFALKNDGIFDFDNDGEIKYDENKFSFPLNIYLDLNPEMDFEIDQLVKIIPYKSANDENGDSYIEKINSPIALGSNKPNDNFISNFNINLNAKNKLGIYPLIDSRKFPIINKVGTVITIKLIFKIDNLIIKKTLVYNRLFNNGYLSIPIQIYNNDLLNTSVSFKNTTINFGIKMFGDQINFFNETPISFSNVNNNNISLSIEEITATIPVEQNTIDSKWYELKGHQYFESNKLEYVGKFETFDPFIFEFHDMQIQINDPITGESMGFASKYKPYFREGEFKEPNGNTENNESSNKDDPIFPKPETNDSNALNVLNLGTYLARKKIDSKDEKYNFQIVIKEYNPNIEGDNVDDNDKYTIDRWILEISLNRSLDKAKFNMTGYSDNKFIEEENKEKYFNDKNPYYRGDYVDKNTGMYIPKIVWVNAYPPESFLYDPLDENDKNIVSNLKSVYDQELASKKAKYDVGYIAELNATGFSNDDYASIPTFGGYDTYFNTNTFTPTGQIPYLEFYNFSENGLEPSVKKVNLSWSGFQINKSNYDFSQLVLRRTNTNNYLYQFVKIANSTEDIVNHQDLISLYGNLKGLKGKSLFQDFWETYQGRHLKDFLYKYSIIKTEGDLKSLSYSDVIQYWNTYVNDPSHYKQYSSSQTNNIDSDIEYNINSLNDVRIDIKEDNLEKLKTTVILKTEDWLTKQLYEKRWINPNLKLKYGVHFRIEKSETIFDKKIVQLLEKYSSDLNADNAIVNFTIIMNTDAFNNETIKPHGEKIIDFLNNKDIDKIVDLDNYNGSRLSINTKHPYFNESNNMIDLIKNTIIDSINNDFKRILNGCKLIEPNYIPKLNEDYQLEFYAKYFDDYHNEQKYYYNSFDDAIKDDLLFETNKNNFYNILNINIIANSNSKSRFMKNSFSKTIINDSNQKEAILDTIPFNISSINAYDIKVNTKLIKLENNSSIENVLYNLIFDRIKNDILFYTKKWIYFNQIIPKLNIDYETIFIKGFDENKQPIYYDKNLTTKEIYQIIDKHLINGIENEPTFNRDLYFEIRAKKGGLLEGKFIKKINNNFLNKAIESDELINENIDINNGINNEINNENNSNENNNSNNNNQESENIKNHLNNENGKGDNFNWWWVITPLTIFVLCVIILITVYCIRKNRRIR